MISHHPKKHLGQNFLHDRRIQEKIIQACDLKPEDTVLEIGPGQGAITRLIAPLVNRLIAIETDADLIEPLNQLLNGSGPLNSRDQVRSVEIIHADFLKWDFSSLCHPRERSSYRTCASCFGDPVKVIGNIPYNVSTPIIEKLIENRNKVSQAFLTVQLEFGQRLVASHGGKDYGSLSCYVQYYADTKMLFKIKNSCFKPVPKVDSCFLCMTMRQHPEAIDGIEDFLFKLIQTAFQQRRKNIVNSLKGLLERPKLEQALQRLGINANARPEEISLSNYIALSKWLML